MPRLKAEGELRQLVLMAAATGNMRPIDRAELWRTLSRESLPEQAPQRASITDIRALGIKVVDKRKG